MDAIHGRAGADDRIEAENRLVRVFGRQPVDHVDLGADRQDRTRLGRFDGLADEVGRTRRVGRIHDRHRAFGMHDDLDAGIVGPGFVDLRNGETLVDRTEAVPQQDLGITEFGFGVAAEGFARIPHRHAFERNAHRLGGVAPEVLIGEEQDPLAAFEGPFQDGRSVGRRTDDAAVLSAKCLERCRGIHVSDRDDRLLAFGVRVGSVDFGDLFPAGIN